MHVQSTCIHVSVVRDDGMNRFYNFIANLNVRNQFGRLSANVVSLEKQR